MAAHALYRRADLHAALRLCLPVLRGLAGAAVGAIVATGLGLGIAASLVFDDVRRIRAGMSADEVTALLGPPDRRTRVLAGCLTEPRWTGGCDRSGRASRYLHWETLAPARIVVGLDDAGTVVFRTVGQD